MTTARRQRASGALFAGLALLVALGAVLNVREGANWIAATQLAGAGFLGYLAWRQLQPTREITVPTSDERTQDEARRAASTAFWSLMIVLLAESSFDVIPATLEPSVYMLLAMGFLGLAWGYQKLAGG